MWSTTCVFAICAILFCCLFANEIDGTPVIVERLDHMTNCPRIVSREEWKARNATEGYIQLPYSPTPYVTVHHGGILQYCYDQTECSTIVRSYQDLHIDDRKWIDIGYNFVIGEDGNVYEGRGWDSVGAHAPGYNTQSIGVSIIGDFSHFIPNKPALKALKSLIACGVQLGKISPDYKVIGHRQARDTVCPGEVFYEWVQKMPGWTATPTAVYGNDDSTPATVTTRTPIAGNTLEDGNIPKDTTV